jgi:hypothetical protein
VQYNGTEITGSGSCTLAEATHNYVWVKDSATVSFARAVEAHIVSSSSGTIGDAAYFSAVSLTHTGTGVINSLKGYSCADLGDATRVNNASGYFCGNFTQPVSFAAAFQSEMAAGTNKWGFYHTGTAPSALNGNLAIGFATAPLFPLHISAANNNFVSVMQNSHASNPFGLRINYSATAPNSTGNSFINCADSVATRFEVASNGNVFIGGSRVVSTRQTGCPAAATDLASAITLVNFLRTALIAHGLIS